MIKTNNIMNAIIKFPLRAEAETFAKNYARYSKKGYSLGTGLVNVEVTIWDVTDQDEQWIDSYINNINNK